MEGIGTFGAGFVAIVIVGAFYRLLHSLNLIHFSPSEQVGCLFVRDPRHPAAESIGFVLLLVIGSSVVPALYSEVLSRWSGPSWGSGMSLGVLHGVLSAAALPLLGMISACMRAGRLPAPGVFGIRWGWSTPIALLVGHGLYGGIFGAIVAKL